MALNWLFPYPLSTLSLRQQGAYEVFAGMVDLMPLPVADADRPKMLRYEQMERLGSAFVEEMPRLLSAVRLLPRLKNSCES